MTEQPETIHFLPSKDACAKKYGEYDPEKHLYLSCDVTAKTGAKSFAMIPYSIKLLKRLIRATDEVERNYYTIIPTADTVQKIRFDVDCKRADVGDDEVWVDLAINLKPMIISAVRHSLRELYDLKPTTPFRFSVDNSSTAKKLSYHIVLQDRFVANNLEAKAVAEHLRSSEFFAKYVRYVDVAPYSAFQNWRLRYCCKKGKENVKRPEQGSLADSIPVPSPSELRTAHIFRCVVPARQKAHIRSHETPAITSDDDLTTLVALITESVTAGEHSLCDSECPEQLCYDNWKKLIFAIARVSNGEAVELAKRCVPLYRHYEDLNDVDTTIEAMMVRTQYGWTVASLHYWAQENGKYREHFKPDVCDALEYNPLDVDYEEWRDDYVRLLPSGKGKDQVIHAYMGKGKSVATRKLIDSLPAEDSALIVTPRITYSQGVYTELREHSNKRFVTYRDSSVRQRLPQQQYLIIQAESLWKIYDRIKAGGYTYIIVDECESFLTQMTVAQTHKDMILTNQEVFSSLLSHCHRAYWLDAFISKRTTQFLEDCRRQFQLKRLTAEPVKRRAFEVDDKSELISLLVKKLGEGGRYLFFSSSCTQLLETFLPTIRKALPAINIVEHHSKKKFNDGESVRDTWKGADLVAITGSVTVGLNFDLADEFNGIFIYANAPSKNRVRDIFQAHMRVRHLKDNVLYYCLDTKVVGGPLPVFRGEIINRLKRSVRYSKEMFTDEYEDIDVAYFNLTVTNAQEHGLSVTYLRAMFAKYLALCNYQREEEEEGPTQDLALVTAELGVQLSFKDIVECTPSEIRELRRRKREKTATPMELARIEKYYFQNCVIDLNDRTQERLWIMYNDFGQVKFRNLCYEKGLLQGEFTLAQLINATSMKNIYNDGFALRLGMVQMLCELVGLESTHDRKEISPQTLDRCSTEIKRFSRKIADAFRFRNDRRTPKPKKADYQRALLQTEGVDEAQVATAKVAELKGMVTAHAGSEKDALALVRKGMSEEFGTKDVASFLNRVLKSWGYSSLTRGAQRRVRVDGCRVDVADYKIEEKEEVYKYIKPKVFTRGKRHLK